MPTPSCAEPIGGVAATEVSGNDGFDTAHMNYKQQINQDGHRTRHTFSARKEVESNSFHHSPPGSMDIGSSALANAMARKSSKPFIISLWLSV